MTDQSGLVLFDTNIVVHVMRKSTLGQRAAADAQGMNPDERPLISVVTIGEMKSLARKWGWGTAPSRLKEAGRARSVPESRKRTGKIGSPFASFDGTRRSSLHPDAGISDGPPGGLASSRLALRVNLSIQASPKTTRAFRMLCTSQTRRVFSTPGGPPRAFSSM